jgi:hypothetical protein
MFIINTSAEPDMQLPQRSLLAATTDHLLDLLAELGPRRVRSVYQLSRGTADDEDAIMFNRLTAIDVSEDGQDGVPIVDGRDIEAVARSINRVEVARFKKTEREPIGEEGGDASPNAT